MASLYSVSTNAAFMNTRLRVMDIISPRVMLQTILIINVSNLFTLEICIHVYSCNGRSICRYEPLNYSWVLCIDIYTVVFREAF